MSAPSTTAIDLSARISRHPYRSLLIATGVGYVLAGGLFTRLTYGMLRASVRVATLPVVQRELLAIAAMALGMQAAQAAPHNDTPIDSR